VRDRNPQQLPFRSALREWRVRSLDREINELAHEPETFVAHQHSGKQAGFDQNLKSVADAEYRATASREAFDGGHHRGKARDGAAPQVVSIRKPAGKDDRVDIAETPGIMPDELRLLAEGVGDRVPGIVISIAARKDDNTDFHGVLSV
jgi:hypothetical protein